MHVIREVMRQGNTRTAVFTGRTVVADVRILGEG